MDNLKRGFEASFNQRGGFGHFDAPALAAYLIATRGTLNANEMSSVLEDPRNWLASVS